jgi:diguanylate cyclase (GGDEF)-like protein/PAS domain S-box-containing protein
MRKWVMRGYLAANVPLALATFALPGYHLVLWGLLGLSASAAVVVGVVRNRPGRRLPWLLVAASLATFVTGDIAYDVLTKVLHQNNPFPSVADALYLATYPLLTLGLLGMVRARRREKDFGALLDALIVTVACALLSWVYLIQPYVRAHDMTLFQKVTSVAYPLGDIAILCLLVRLVLTGALRNRSLGLLTLGGIGVLAADAAYGAIQLNGTWKVGGPVDLGWVLFYVCWGAAALHPSMVQLTAAQPRREKHLSLTTLLVLSATTLAAPALLVWQAATSGVARDAGVIGATSALLFVLVMARMTGLARAQAAQARRERALRAMGERLVAASELGEVDAAAIEGVRAMFGSGVTACLVTVPEGTRQRVTAAEPLGFVGGLLEMEETDGRLVGVRGLDGSRVLATSSGTRWESMVLLGRDGPSRRVLFAHSGRLPLGSEAVVDALAAQLSLAADRVQLAKALHQRQSEAKFRALIQNASDVILVAGANGEVRFETPSTDAVLGYSLDAANALSLTSLLHPDDTHGATALIEAMLAGSRSGPIAAEWRVRHLDGRWLDMEVIANDLSEDANVAGVVLTLRDVSQRKVLEDELRHRAFHDSLTNLANRVLFADRVEHALSRRARSGTDVSVLVLDVDDFKVVNDNLGHAAGDELLVQLAERLLACSREGDTVARLGGDEFAVCIEIVAGSQPDVASTAQRILEVVRAPFPVAGSDVAARVSIGVSTADRTTVSAAEMLRQADLALYAAKNAGKGSYQFFEPGLHRMVLDRLERRAALEEAIESGQLLLHYQPVMRLSDGEIVGMEALVRWQHPDDGLVPPLEFIPLAEESGLVVALGRWVLDRACADVSRWQSKWTMAGRPPLRVAVNVSPRQLQSTDFLRMVDATLARHHVDPSWLTIEITESVLVQDSEEVMTRLRDLDRRGITLALDDFGTGYSSLSYLHRFPIKILKIDQSFVRGMDEHDDRLKILDAIVSLASSLGLELIAEGIEHESQARYLRELGCEYGQGFHFGRPVPAQAMDELLNLECDARPDFVGGEPVSAIAGPLR